MDYLDGPNGTLKAEEGGRQREGVPGRRELQKKDTERRWRERAHEPRNVKAL